MILGISNANLQSLRLNIEGLVPDFQSDIYKYDLTISNAINDIEVLGVSENPNAKIEITGNTGLKEGQNLIRVKVISEDETQTKEYIITVTKTANLELANTNLETLAIQNALLTPAFDNHITQYDTEVSNELTKLNLLAIPENEKAKVQISGNENLQEGNNIITVVVTAANGITKREYRINVYKRNVTEEEIYKKEQEQLQEKLEQAYEIEKTSDVKEGARSVVQEEQKEDKNYVVIVIIAVLVVVAVIGGIVYYRKRKKDI